MTDAFESILRHEGFRQYVYDDANGQMLKAGDVVRGTPTIGHGITFLTEDESKMVVRLKLEQLESQLQSHLPWLEDAPKAIQDVVLEMSYQMGVNGVLRFARMLAAMVVGEYDTAADEMLESRWARVQTPHRAQRLADIVRTV